MLSLITLITLDATGVLGSPPLLAALVMPIACAAIVLVIWLSMRELVSRRLAGWVAGFLAIPLCVLVVWSVAASNKPLEDISEHYAVRRVGDTPFGDAHLDVYAREPSGMRYLGSTGTGFGPPITKELDVSETTLALSKDGRSIAFHHYEHLARGMKPGASGIYRHTSGGELELVHPASELRQEWTHWEKPIPGDVLVLNLKEEGSAETLETLTGPRSFSWALTADGREFPLALLEGSKLHEAAFEGNVARAQEGLEQGLEVDGLTYWGNTPLEIALARDREDVAVVLIQHGANLKRKGWPVMFRAAQHGMLHAMEALLARGFDVNHADTEGDTPLHAAGFGRGDQWHDSSLFGDTDRALVGERRARAIQWLLDHGADRTARNKDGQKPNLTR